MTTTTAAGRALHAVVADRIDGLNGLLATYRVGERQTDEEAWAKLDRRMTERVVQAVTAVEREAAADALRAARGRVEALITDKTDIATWDRAVEACLAALEEPAHE